MKTLEINYLKVKREVDRILANNHYYKLVAVEFVNDPPALNKLVYWNEAQIRAFQLYVKKVYREEGEEAYQELMRRVIIYNGRTKRRSKRIEICRDGYLDEPFPRGFFTITRDLSDELL